MFFFHNLNRETFLKLVNEREEIKSKIANLQFQLSQSEMIFNLLDSVFNPKVSIQEVNNPNMGHRFLGKVKVLEPDGKTPKIIGFSIGRADQYKGIKDPKLIKEANKKASEKIKSLYPNYFS